MSTEFVKQTMRDNLSRTLVPHIADGLWSVYDNALKACERNGQPEKTLQTFQNLLTRIPQWSDDILAKEVERIIVASKCDYIQDLLLGVFVSYIRAFASLQQTTEAAQVKIEFERPTVAVFVHTFYKQAARKSWSTAYLFKTMGVSSEQQARNRREIEIMLEAILNEVIDSFIPWRSISQAYFHAKEEAKKPEETAKPPPVTFEEKPDVREFDSEAEESSDEEEDSDEERPRVQLGEDVQLDLDDVEDDKASISTEDEIASKTVDVVALNL